ncbi:uncharacterized protein LOC124914759 [Impatiens glandulifera]|uniref:uncharacterized protein LOC124914759 n=1 Tax=Impatiens glandulifera TaxID=253017 RepID=UPI001FB18EE0|nr:uncharacterized protein LOC124914759 [Impatiens glandulifera]
MAYLLANLSSSTLLHSNGVSQQQSAFSLCFHSHPHPTKTSPTLLPQLKVTQVLQNPNCTTSYSSVDEEDNNKKETQHRNDFYVNLGLAVRTLREDIPLIFVKDLNYDIYRDDVTFVDPLNTFTGIEKYKLIFWALRFHGRILFREIAIDVLRVWQPSENMILIRWNLRGVPRVPWEAKGQFQGTSRYKLDRNGKIYEHKVDNLAFNFPQNLKPAASVLDFVAACPASPNPTFFLWDDDNSNNNPSSSSSSSSSSSWVELYRAVRETLDHQTSHITLVHHDQLATCS